MEEKWSTVEEFTMYKVSNFGDVVNQTTGKVLNLSQTRTGLVKVGMVRGGVQYTRGLSILVADAFVFGRTEVFDTPIHLDGDQTNNRADNLMWRPRWFAWKYFRQFTDSQYHDRGPLVDLETGIWYNTILEASIEHGLLFRDVMRSIGIKEATFPTWQMFAFRD